MTKKNSFPSEASQFLKDITSLAETNPFSLERAMLELEQSATSRKVEPLHALNRPWKEQQAHVLMEKLGDCLKSLSGGVREHGESLPLDEKEAYRNAVWFMAYHLHRHAIDEHIRACRTNPDQNPPVDSDLFKAFRNDIAIQLNLSKSQGYRDNPLCMSEQDIDEVFAFCFQLRRGYLEIVERLIGASTSATRLREAVWESIFTRRLLWSFQYLMDRMSGFSTLILGPSGTGKDLVAEIIGASQHIPYLRRENRFAINFTAACRAVNLSALSPGLIESELFGHARGAFTGATSARQGHLELCSEYGALFLDEIGDLSPEIQVKLLRTLQTREFFPLGESRARRFTGRILSATNQDIPSLVAEGRMRQDFLYRIGAIVIQTPSLAERFQECPDEAEVLLPHFLGKILGRIDEGVRAEIESKIQGLLASGYAWPGNVREFEQCVRTLLVAKEHTPLVTAKRTGDELESLFTRMRSVEANLPDLLSAYCHHALARLGSYQAAAERLGVDWRTIKKHADAR